MDLRPQATKEYIAWASHNPLPGKHRRASASTLESYASDLDLFAKWFIQSRDLELGPKTLTPDDIQDYISYSRTVEERAVSTILRRFAAIRSYCLYLQETDERINRDLTAGIMLPKAEAAQKRGLRRLERLALERAFTVPWKNTARGKIALARDYAIVMTLMYVGLRVEEAANLRVDDLDVRSRSTASSIRVREGKGNKDRTVGVPKKARDALDAWLETRAALGVNHNAVFVQVRKGYKPFSVRGMQRSVKAAAERANLDPDVEVSAHILRHTAKRVWRKKTDDRTTAAQLGHSVATMLRYDALKTGDVLKAAEKI